MPRTVSTNKPAFTPSRTTTSHSGGAQPEFAHLGLRMVAYIFDTLLLALPLTLGIWYSAAQPGILAMGVAAFQVMVGVWLPWIFVCVSYEVVGLSRWGQTVGKALVGIKVTDEAGKLLTWKRTFFRHQIAKMVSFSPLGLGLWSAAFDKEKRTWHDHLSASLVIVTEPRLAVGVIAVLALLGLHGYITFQAIRSFTSDLALMEFLRNSFSILETL